MFIRGVIGVQPIQQHGVVRLWDSEITRSWSYEIAGVFDVEILILRDSLCRREYISGEAGGMSIRFVIVLSTACWGLAYLHSTRLRAGESTACFCMYGTPMTLIINIPPTLPYLYSLLSRNEGKLHNIISVRCSRRDVYYGGQRYAVYPAAISLVNRL